MTSVALSERMGKAAETRPDLAERISKAAAIVREHLAHRRHLLRHHQREFRVGELVGLQHRVAHHHGALGDHHRSAGAELGHAEPQPEGRELQIQHGGRMVGREARLDAFHGDRAPPLGRRSERPDAGLRSARQGPALSPLVPNAIARRARASQAFAEPACPRTPSGPT